jgi:flagellar biosynthesis protein FlhG
MIRREAARTISITSGKGGVGKSTLVANTAVKLADAGRRILLLDGDFGMANLDIIFGVTAAATQGSLADVVAGQASIDDIIVRASSGVDLIPGGSGLSSLQHLNGPQKQRLLDQVSSLAFDYDLMFVDTAPGLADHVLYLNSAAQEIAVVVTPDPASLADSYALIKVLNQRCREERFTVICNQVKDEEDGKRLFLRLTEVASRFLSVRLEYGGSVPTDPILRQCTRLRQLVSVEQPDSPSVAAMARIGRRFEGLPAQAEPKGGLQFFWNQLVSAPALA